MFGGLNIITFIAAFLKVDFTAITVPRSYIHMLVLGGVIDTSF